jgi:hypothetical protein
LVHIRNYNKNKEVRIAYVLQANRVYS